MSLKYEPGYQVIKANPGYTPHEIALTLTKGWNKLPADAKTKYELREAKDSRVPPPVVPPPAVVPKPQP